MPLSVLEVLFLLHVMVGSNSYKYQCAATVEHVLGSVKFLSFLETSRASNCGTE